MNRILIHMDIRKYGEYDIFHETDYQKFDDVVQNVYGGNCPNMGNRLWFQAIISEISDGKNQIYYYDSKMKPEEINERYDFIIAPMANVFSVHYIELLNHLTKKFENIKIPIYVIACGVQANDYNDLDHVYEVLKEPATRFISTIYRTGGEFALRGYFTKEFFKKLGFYSAVVTGCPSMFQMGRTLQIYKKNLQREELHPILNGNINMFEPLYKQFPKSEFMDQQAFYDLLYNKAFMDRKIDIKFLKKLIQIYGMTTINLCVEQRVNLIMDMSFWKEYLQDQKFNFSFGGRIHGNIMSILCGIPAVVYACDSRTREMVEFFDLPYILPSEYKGDLFEIYEKSDFTKFNQNFVKRFNDFEKFLKKFKIVDHVNENNLFMNQKINNYNKNKGNSEKLEELKDIIEKNRLKCNIFETMIRLRRTFR